MPMQPIKIKTPKGIRLIGPGQPVFIVAELSCNHNGSYKRALKIIDQAAQAGADAIKLQAYTPDTITIDSDKEIFQIKVNKAWQGQTLYSLYQKAYTPWDWLPKLKNYGEKKGLFVFSSTVDTTGVDFLEKLKVQIYKVPSFEIIDIPLLKRIARTKKPVIISRGMASVADVKLAIKTLKNNGTRQIALLHCVSSYPAKPEQMNLRTIPDIVKKFKVIAGLSDHSLDSLGGINVPIASVALGAAIVEKHFTLKRSDGGPDAAFSIQPEELKLLVKSIRETESALGRPTYKPVNQQEKENIVFRKSLIVVADIKKGQKFTAQNVRSIRPGHGLHPKYYEKVMGKTARQNIERGEPLAWKLIKK